MSGGERSDLGADTPAPVGTCEGPQAASPKLSAALVPAKLVSAALLLLALAFGVESLKLGLWVNGMPGIGLTSLLASAILVPVSAVLLIQPIGPEERTPLELAPFLGGFGFLLYVAAVEYLGLVLPTLAFSLIWASLVYRRPWWIGGIAALAITGAIYLVFRRFLSIPIALWPG